MVNSSKQRDFRFRRKWGAAGAIGSDATAIFDSNPRLRRFGLESAGGSVRFEGKELDVQALRQANDVLSGHFYGFGYRINDYSKEARSSNANWGGFIYPEYEKVFDFMVKLFGADKTVKDFLAPVGKGEIKASDYGALPEDLKPLVRVPYHFCCTNEAPGRAYAAKKIGELGRDGKYNHVLEQLALAEERTDVREDILQAIEKTSDPNRYDTLTGVAVAPNCVWYQKLDVIKMIEDANSDGGKNHLLKRLKTALASSRRN